jgi:hypothetical protein
MALTAWPTTLSARAPAVRLVVFIGFLMEIRRIGGHRGSLPREIMRLGAALVDEVFRQIEIFPLAGDAGELDQRQLHFLMAAIARFLPGRGRSTVAIM